MELFCWICRQWTAHTKRHCCCTQCGEPQCATMMRAVVTAPEGADETRLDRFVQLENCKEKGFLLRRGFMDDYGNVFRVASRFLP